MTLQFLRTDDPAVTDGKGAYRSCASCHFWSRWLPHTGDCMLYALRRQAAWLEAFDAGELGAFHESWPVKSARTTSDHETCTDWETRDGLR